MTVSEMKSSLFDIFAVAAPLSIIFYFMHNRVHGKFYEALSFIVVAFIYLKLLAILKKQFFHDESVQTLGLNDMIMSILYQT